MKLRWGLGVVLGVSAATWVSTAAIDWNSVGGGMAQGRIAALSAMVRDPLMLLAMRSPGERSPGALMSSKPTRVADKGEPAPVERVLPTVRERPPVYLLGDTPAELEGIELTPFGPVPVGGDFVPVPTPEFVGPITGGPLYPPFWPGGGGGGGGGGQPPTSPVPEPATWAMMILGFFTAGFAIRRSRMRRAQA